MFVSDAHGGRVVGRCPVDRRSKRSFSSFSRFGARSADVLSSLASRSSSLSRARLVAGLEQAPARDAGGSPAVPARASTPCAAARRRAWHRRCCDRAIQPSVSRIRGLKGASRYACSAYSSALRVLVLGQHPREVVEQRRRCRRRSRAPSGSAGPPPRSPSAAGSCCASSSGSVDVLRMVLHPFGRPSPSHRPRLPAFCQRHVIARLRAPASAAVASAICDTRRRLRPLLLRAT